MEWYLILLIILGSILICYLIASCITFKLIFGYGTDKSLEDVDLRNTHYEPYIEEVYSAIKAMKREEYKDEYILSGNVKLYGRYFYRGGSRTIIMVHGYRATPYNNFSVPALYFLNNGYNILFVYQRAHEYSGGKLKTFGYKESKDMYLWSKYIYEKYNQNIILYGTSMGASTVITTEAFYDSPFIKGVIADSTFTNAYKTISKTFKKNRFPPILIMPLIRVYSSILGFSLTKRSPIESIDKVKVPTIFIHSKRDKIVNYNDSELLYEKLKAPKLLSLTDKGGHTTGFLVSSNEEKTKILKFIEEEMK